MVTQTLVSVKDAVKALLLQRIASNQEDICHRLEAQGFHVNQSKVSRLLRQLGAVKVKNEQGDVVYSLPKEPAPPPTESPLANLIINITNNEYMIVIHTSPGAASLIARLLDYNRDKASILGTVAGDDTIFVVPKSEKKLNLVLQEVRTLLSNVK